MSVGQKADLDILSREIHYFCSTKAKTVTNRKHQIIQDRLQMVVSSLQTKNDILY
jgi:hypothetical protein